VSLADRAPKPSGYNPLQLPERLITEARIVSFGPVSLSGQPGRAVDAADLEKFELPPFSCEEVTRAELLRATRQRQADRWHGVVPGLPSGLRHLRADEGLCR
jgi:hypothetical protein